LDKENLTLENYQNKPIVLIVDDSVENLHILSSLLKDSYQIRIAKSGAKALELAKQEPLPDLILLDVLMPEMDGFETCKQLKSNSLTQRIPVIFLTALNEASDETAGFAYGGADFITKPFNPDVVKARIQTHVALRQERQKSESLLRVLLPENVISDLIEKGSHRPEIHKNVSILFCDFVGFTVVTSMLSPEFLIEELSEIFSAFDEICEREGAVRIKTIGDAYMAATGLAQNDSEHASRLVRVAQHFIGFLNQRNQHSKQQWQCRIGVHSGEVIAGIVGKNRFIYDILGDDVNIAARVESNGVPMKVTITDATRQLLCNDEVSNSLGFVKLKGKGDMELFVVG
jgi:class 3 adenylate cyclase